MKNAPSTNGNYSRPIIRHRDLWLGKPLFKMVNGAWMCRVSNPYGQTPFVGVAASLQGAFQALKASIAFRLASKGYKNVEFCE